MIGDRVNVEKKRPLAALALHNVDRSIEIKAIRLEVTRTEVDHIKIARDSHARLKGARAEKSSIEWIEAETLVAAAIQCRRQPATDAAGGNPGHRRGETPIRANRKTGEHVVFRKPTRSADAFHDEL